jgi:hypothetical protein
MSCTDLDKNCIVISESFINRGIIGSENIKNNYNN